MKKLFLLLTALIFTACQPKTENFNRAAAEIEIRGLLLLQQDAWNAGNIDQFMEGYWKSDSLEFIGKNVTIGWQKTLERYKASYPDKKAMGQLEFAFYEFRFITPTDCLVTGKYFLTRETDSPNGLFTLLVKKIKGQWVVVYDHTS